MKDKKITFVKIPDFNEWMLNMGIDVNKQYEQTEAMLLVFERLYDLITDIRKNMVWSPNER